MPFPKFTVAFIYLILKITLLTGAENRVPTNLKILTSPSEFQKLYPSAENVAWAPLKNGACRIVVVRHGESTSNAGTGNIRIAGRLDVDLTERGREQAREIARLLAKTLPNSAADVGAFYSSPLKRALQTAEEFQKIWNASQTPLIPDERLYETWYAELEGATGPIYDPHDERQSRELADKPSFAARQEYRLVPNMENMQEVFKRTTSCFLEIAKTHPGKTVVVTTHNGPVKSQFIHWTAWKKGYELFYDGFIVSNASVLIFESNGEELDLISVDGLKPKTK